MTLENGEAEKRGWFQRLKSGLSRTSTKITGGITGLFTKKKLDHRLLHGPPFFRQSLIIQM